MSKEVCLLRSSSVNAQLAFNGSSDAEQELQLIAKSLRGSLKSITSVFEGDQSLNSNLSSPTSPTSRRKDQGLHNKLTVEWTTSMDVLPTLHPNVLHQYADNIAKKRSYKPTSRKQLLLEQLREEEILRILPTAPPLDEDRPNHRIPVRTQCLSSDKNSESGSFDVQGESTSSSTAQDGMPELKRPWGDRKARLEKSGIVVQKAHWRPELITHVCIRHNYQLAYLPIDSLRELRLLRSLDLSYNALRLIPRRLFAPRSFPSSLETAVVTVDASSASQEQSFSATLPQLASTSPPAASTSPFPELDELILDNNCLCYLPNEVGTLKKLRILSVENNALVGIPNELRYMELLEVLRLSNNNWIDDQGDDRVRESTPKDEAEVERVDVDNSHDVAAEAQETNRVLFEGADHNDENEPQLSPWESRSRVGSKLLHTLLSDQVQTRDKSANMKTAQLPEGLVLEEVVLSDDGVSRLEASEHHLITATLPVENYCCSLCSSSLLLVPEENNPSEGSAIMHRKNPFALVTFVDFLMNKSVPVLFFVCPPPTSAVSVVVGDEDDVHHVRDNDCGGIIVRDVMESTPVNYTKLVYPTEY